MNVLGASDRAIERAAAALRDGLLVAFPTETVYGLGADATNPDAVERIFAAKGRPADHPLIVHLPEAAAMERWAARVPAAARTLADAFWPGPLTLILPRSPGVLDIVTGGQDTVGLRVPGHPVARALLRAFGGAVAAPSANRFGRISPTRAEHVAGDLDDRVALILDGGPCEVGLESTIVDLSGARPRLLRPGGIAATAIEGLLGAPLVPPRADPGATRADPAPPRAPGTLASHYAPTAAARLVAPERLLAARDRAGHAAAVLARRTAPDALPGWYALPTDPAGYARALYAALRRADADAPEVILIEDVPRGRAWEAVRDRLERACAPRPAPATANPGRAHAADLLEDTP